MWARVFGDSAIGYHREISVECLATRETRTVIKDYYFTSVPDADDASVTYIHYETTKETIEKQQS